MYPARYPSFSFCFSSFVYVLALYMAIQTALFLYASERSTGSVMDSDDSLSYTVHNVTDCDLTEHSMMNVTEHEYSLTAAAEREFIRDVKEKLRYIGADYNTVHQSTGKRLASLLTKTSSPLSPIFVAQKFCSTRISLVNEPLECTTLLSRAT